MRVTVPEVPGSLAALCTGLARLRTDILALQTHPLPEGTVDEVVLRAPVEVPAQRLEAVAASTGGRDVWIEQADTHDLVDLPTRMLNLASRTAMDVAELPLTLRRIFGRCTVRSTLAGQAPDSGAGFTKGRENLLDGTLMRLRDPSNGGFLTVSRPYLPFTPSEFARARALIELETRVSPGVPGHRRIITLPAAGRITIRRAGPEDFEAALALHDRCSPTTLKARYHGPVIDADRYLAHLLSPRYGRALAVECETGQLVALAHLLWDDDETEVALLVEDEWQRRGIGQTLLRELVAMAHEAGRASVYAVTGPRNPGMVAAMRRLRLPLDYQAEDGALVITASLTAAQDLSSASVDRG